MSDTLDYGAAASALQSFLANPPTYLQAQNPFAAAAVRPPPSNGSLFPSQEQAAWAREAQAMPVARKGDISQNPVGWESTTDPFDPPVEGAGGRTRSEVANSILRRQAVTDSAIGATSSLPSGIRAFHGSPHQFDRFDASKIGTGEGAQAYGHGLYFAGNEEVARTYRDALAVGQTPEQIAAHYLADANGHRPTAIAAMADHAVVGLGWPAHYASALRKGLRLLQSGADITPSAPGSMYEVNLGVQPGQLLDWDKPVMDQPQAVQDFVRRVRDSFPGRHAANDARNGTLPGAGVYNGLAQGIADRGFSDAGPSADASRQLLDAGIPGVQYLDAGSRRMPQMAEQEIKAQEAHVANLQAGIPQLQQRLASLTPLTAEHNQAALDLLTHQSALQDAVPRLEQLRANAPQATRNYVMFPGAEDMISIVRRYGIAALTIPGFAEALRASMPAQPQQQQGAPAR